MTFTNLTDALRWARADERRRVKYPIWVHSFLSFSNGHPKIWCGENDAYSSEHSLNMWDDLLTATEFIGIEPEVEKVWQCGKCSETFRTDQLHAQHTCKSELDRVIEEERTYWSWNREEEFDSLKRIAHAIVKEARK